MTKIKSINLTIHDGNYRRRVRYNDKNDFEVLAVNLDDGIRTRTFQIESRHLTDKDSIHLVYDPVSHGVSWSPKGIINYVVEVI